MDDASLLPEVTKLKTQLKELQAKYESQGILLRQTEQSLRDLRNKVREETEYTDENESKREILKLHQVKQELSTQVAQLMAENAQLSEQCERLSEHTTVVDSELQAASVTHNTLQKNLETAKSLAASYEKEARGFEEKLHARSEEIEDLVTKIKEREDLLSTLEEEVRRVNDSKAEMDRLHRKVGRMEKQMLLVVREATRKQNELQNLLQGSRQLLEEVKAEYQEFSDAVAEETATERAAAESKHRKLQVDFQNYKLMQLEDRAQIQREHSAVLHALRAQFAEYRSTAEFLFSTEAAKMEDRLSAAMARYEAEIRYVIRSKDAHYDQMMTAKDSKILSLIEGTDFQALLIKHEMELEQARRRGSEEVARVKRVTEAAQKKVIAALQQDLLAQQLGLEKLHGRLRAQEGSILQAHDAVVAKEAQLVAAARAGEAALRKVEAQLEAAHARSEALQRDKAGLRHALVRLRVGRRSDGDGSVAAGLERLVAESETLQRKYRELMNRHEVALTELSEQRTSADACQAKLRSATAQLHSRTAELHSLSQAFERSLYQRAAEMGVVAADHPVFRAHSTATAAAAAAAAGSTAEGSGGEEDGPAEVTLPRVLTMSLSGALGAGRLRNPRSRGSSGGRPVGRLDGSNSSDGGGGGGGGGTETMSMAQARGILKHLLQEYEVESSMRQWDAAAATATTTEQGQQQGLAPVAGKRAPRGRQQRGSGSSSSGSLKGGRLRRAAASASPGAGRSRARVRAQVPRKLGKVKRQAMAGLFPAPSLSGSSQPPPAPVANSSGGGGSGGAVGALSAGSGEAVTTASVADLTRGFEFLQQFKRQSYACADGRVDRPSRAGSRSSSSNGTPSQRHRTQQRRRRRQGQAQGVHGTMGQESSAVAPGMGTGYTVAGSPARAGMRGSKLSTPSGATVAAAAAATTSESGRFGPVFSRQGSGESSQAEGASFSAAVLGSGWSTGAVDTPEPSLPGGGTGGNGSRSSGGGGSGSGSGSGGGSDSGRRDGDGDGDGDGASCGSVAGEVGTLNTPRLHYADEEEEDEEEGGDHTGSDVASAGAATAASEAGEVGAATVEREGSNGQQVITRAKPSSPLPSSAEGRGGPGTTTPGGGASIRGWSAGGVGVSGGMVLGEATVYAASGHAALRADGRNMIPHTASGDAPLYAPSPPPAGGKRRGKKKKTAGGGSKQGVGGGRAFAGVRRGLTPRKPAQQYTTDD